MTLDRRWLLGCEVDCGELVPGHRFVVTGITDDGPTPHPETGQPHPGFGVEYELRPGVTEEEAAAAGGWFHLLVSVDPDADPPFPWPVSDGGPVTYGARGTWPLPSPTAVLRFALAPPDRSRIAGVLVVDLGGRTADWRPA